MQVRPRSGLLVRDPANPPIPLPAEGAEVPRTTYWLRRLAKGDVELVNDRDALREIQAREDQAKPPEN
jgi:hypothetical protein